MTVAVVSAVVGIPIGVLAYSGLWRSWTGPRHDRAWALSALWFGIGGAVLAIGLGLPSDNGTPSAVAALGAVVAGLALCSGWWMPPPLRPRWYRAQYPRRRPR